MHTPDNKLFMCTSCLIAEVGFGHRNRDPYQSDHEFGTILFTALMNGRFLNKGQSVWRLETKKSGENNFLRSLEKPMH